MKNAPQKFFLAANSGEGFVSYFAESYVPGEYRAYIIKGGPGTGKSSFMKFMAAKAIDKGYSVVLCPCSSDPDSLDGVIIEDTKTVFLDGTAPHVVEPRLPGACENIIDLGRFWDSDKLYESRFEISEAATLNSRLHKTAAAYLSAAGEVIYDNYKISKCFTDRNAALKYALKLCKKHLPEKAQKESREFVRFIGGVTPKGVMAFTGSITERYKNIVVIEDKFGGASGEIMKYIRAAAKSVGYNLITVKNHFLPNELIDHILIPELSLAFVRESEYVSFNTDARRIHARRFTQKQIEKKYRGRMLFNRKIARQLLLGAAATLKNAKDAHDVLEKYYIEAMDFKAISEYAAKTAEKLIG